MLEMNIIKEVKMSDSNLSGRIAKITGKSLNNKNITEMLEQLANGALIVQKASEIKKETAEAKKETAETKKKITEVKETADQGVINMLADSMPIDQICRYSGYSPERVSELAKANKISLMQ